MIDLTYIYISSFLFYRFQESCPERIQIFLIRGSTNRLLLANCSTKYHHTIRRIFINYYQYHVFIIYLFIFPCNRFQTSCLERIQIFLLRGSTNRPLLGKKTTKKTGENNILFPRSAMWCLQSLLKELWQIKECDEERRKIEKSCVFFLKIYTFLDSIFLLTHHEIKFKSVKCGYIFFLYLRPVS